MPPSNGQSSDGNEEPLLAPLAAPVVHRAASSDCSPSRPAANEKLSFNNITENLAEVGNSLGKSVSDAIGLVATNVSLRSAAFANAALGVLDPGLSTSPCPSKPSEEKRFRGIFDEGLEEEEDEDEDDEQHGPHKAHTHSWEFLQRLDMLLATDSHARTTSQKLYERFGGDTEELQSLLQLLERRWGFPEQVFPLLWTHLRKAAGKADDPPYVTQDQWCEAFMHWLRALQTRAGRIKVSRQCLVRARDVGDMSKVYLRGEKLGEGTFGEVHLVLHTVLGVARIDKTVAKSQLGMAEEQVQDEVNLLRSLDHPHIVRIFEAFETEETLHIIMDYAGGGDLSVAINTAYTKGNGLKEHWVKVACFQVCSALEYMHSKGVIHCDLKPANVMLVEPFDTSQMQLPHTLLVDFGLSQIFEERRTAGVEAKVKGSPAYLSPEGFEGHLTQKSDMWAVGVILCEMLVGKRPFGGGTNLFMLWAQITKTEPSLDDLPPGAKELARTLLQKDPKVRPAAQDCLRGAWLSHKDVGGPSQLKTFGQDTYVRRAAMLCIASGMSMQERRDLYYFFQEMDTDKSGMISTQELAAGLKKLGMAQDPERIMPMLDMDRSGEISYTEFLAAALQKDQDLTERRVQYAFEMFDLDNDGCISVHELRQMLSGDGPLVEVLPDGQTVDQVMGIISNGTGVITMNQFREYLLQNTGQVERFPTIGGLPPSTEVSRDDVSPDGLPAYHKTKTEVIAEMVEDLDRTVELDETVKENQQVEGFHRWLAKMSLGAHQGAHLTLLLTYKDWNIETLYVAHYQVRTCTQVALLSFLLFVYSLWCISTEGPGGDAEISTSLDNWRHDVLVAHNLSWLWILVSSFIVFLVCVCRAWGLSKRGQSAPVPQIGGSQSSLDATMGDSRAVTLEWWLSAWLSSLPMVVLSFVNRCRTATIFHASSQVMGMLSNDWPREDYDVIMVMFVGLAFLCTRTYMRSICIICIATSGCLAFLLTSVIIDPSDVGNCSEASSDTLWSMFLLALVSYLLVSGQRVVEHHRRVTFYSLYASYMAMSEARAMTARSEKKSLTVDASGQAMTKVAKLNKAAELVLQMGESARAVNRPLATALHELHEVLEDLRDYMMEADRLLQLDAYESLVQDGIEGEELHALLGLFSGMVDVKKKEVVGPASPLAKGLASPSPSNSEPWGWDTLQPTLRPLAPSLEALLLPTAAKLGQGTKKQLSLLVEEMQAAYIPLPRIAEARAALAVHATSWLSERMGLWSKLEPWQRMAMLIAAGGLHCSGGAGVFEKDLMLSRVASTRLVLQVLDRTGLSLQPWGESLRRLVCETMVRALPKSLLEDARWLRVQLGRDDELIQRGQPSAQGTLISLAVGAADFAFCALPAALHESWAHACQEEVRLTPCISGLQQRHFNVAAWMHGLLQVLVLPVYESLGALDATEFFMKVPMECLRDNERHWRKGQLTAEREVLRAGPGPDSSRTGVASWSARPWPLEKSVLSHMDGMCRSAFALPPQPATEKVVSLSNESVAADEDACKLPGIPGPSC